MVRIIERNEYFIVEKIQCLSKSAAITTSMDVRFLITSHLRATTEGIIKEHFGLEIVEELFNYFQKKLTDNNHTFTKEYTPDIEYLFIVLKRKAFDR
ncbi:SAM dependent carboxyl methyltransferase [Corchorus olitorius]|uniref:SAM dependent carboxyl methyltransferase n=1 Tax=Corchorus olitorius TaxID=93759 RepID=A0A1R3HT47_9ROSI|nr:SAM dependent carboxyl methyltransferase [Corchorus olitorius]